MKKRKFIGKSKRDRKNFSRTAVKTHKLNGIGSARGGRRM